MQTLKEKTKMAKLLKPPARDNFETSLIFSLFNICFHPLFFGTHITTTELFPVQHISCAS